MLSWPAAVAGVGCLLGALSVLEFARADSFYSSPSDFVHGHVLEGVGSAGAAYASWLGATASADPSAFGNVASSSPPPPSRARSS